MAQKRKILIVDDDADILTILRGMLKREKFEVMDALCAEEALDILENQDVDLVISDLVMPGMSGKDLLKELREQDSTIPVIFVSGTGNDNEWLQAVRSNACAFIEKPFHRETLLDAIQKAFQESPSPVPKASPTKR